MAGPAPTLKMTGESADSMSSFGQRFEQAAKTVAALTAVLYIVGLLVANEYLIKIGISDFSLLRPKCTLTGGWTVLLFIMCSMPILLPYLHFDYRRADGLKQWKLHLAFAVCGFLSATHMPKALFGVLRVEYANLPHLGGLIFWSCVYVALLVFCREFALGAGEQKGLQRAGILYVFFIAFLIGIMIFTVDVADEVYPRIDEAFGGGKPVPARLVFNKDGLGFWKEVAPGALNSNDGVTSNEVLILHQTDHDFAISTTTKDKNGSKQQVVILNKSLVDGVLPIRHDKAE
jgi:hypothetical protein